MAKILLVEDDDAVRAFVSRALTTKSHDVEIACNGAEGLELLIENEGEYDLMLTDVKMPEMDGIELTQKAEKLFPDLTCLIMTGFADQRDRADNLSKQVYDVILKPFTLSSLTQMVNEALNAKEKPTEQTA